jgi:hypothetical protein
MSRGNWDILQAKFELHESTVYTFSDLTGAFAFYPFKTADGSRAIERISTIPKHQVTVHRVPLTSHRTRHKGGQ